MKTILLSIILVVIILIYPSQAVYTVDEYIYSTGGIHSNDDAQWSDGTNLQVWGENSSGFGQSGTAASQYVTGPGVSQLNVNAELADAYTSSSTLKYTGGGAAWDTLTVNSMTPNESELACTASDIVLTGTDTVSGSIPDHVTAEGMTGAQGPNGIYKSDKLVDSGAYSISAQFQGQGMFHSDWTTKNEVGFDKSSNTLQHIEEARRHKFVPSNLTGGISATVDYTVNLMDFSDPFGLTPSNQTQTNITEEINTTAGEVVNTTEEA